MEIKIVLAGSGGQGIMFLGKLLAQAALLEGKNVTYLPAYGAEVRGGTANCTVVISEEEIGSPYVETADILLAMNEPSLQRFKARVSGKGTVLANKSLIKDAGDSLAFPFTQIAIDLKAPKAANMVAAGCLAKRTRAVKVESVLAALEGLATKSEARELNKKAVETGASL